MQVALFVEHTIYPQLCRNKKTKILKMETTPKKSALKSFLVLASAVAVGYVIGTFAVNGVHKLMDSMSGPKSA